MSISGSLPLRALLVPGVCNISGLPVDALICESGLSVELIFVISREAWGIVMPLPFGLEAPGERPDRGDEAAMLPEPARWPEKRCDGDTDRE